jgi:hypothetical protein
MSLVEKQKKAILSADQVAANDLIDLAKAFGTPRSFS